MVPFRILGFMRSYDMDGVLPQSRRCDDDWVSGDQASDPCQSDCGPTVVIQTCTLRFPDGTEAVGRIEAFSRYQEVGVQYSGRVERLPMRCDRADSVLLRVLFQSFARELGARFEEELVGSWETYSDSGAGEEEPPLPVLEGTDDKPVTESVGRKPRQLANGG
jgi:hypothetical protein